jgi:hypothetical protein
MCERCRVRSCVFSSEATAAATPAQSDAKALYRPRGLDLLRKLLRQRIPAFEAAHEQRYAAFFGKFRLPLIPRAVSAFRPFGDRSQDIARIPCSDCGFDLFRLSSLLSPSAS